MPRAARLLIFLVLVYAFCWIKGWPAYYDDEELPPSQRPKSTTALGGHRVTVDHLVVTVTTAATDAFTKLTPALLYLDKAYHKELLLMGDLMMDIGPFPVFDVLAKYPMKYVAQNDELKRYKRQLEYARKGIPLSNLQEKDPKKEQEVLRALAKYKILRAMESTWEYRPKRDWYVFTDEETFIDRGNLLDWLSQYDPKLKLFFGNPPIADVPDAFAAGGTSFIVSGQTMRLLFEDRKTMMQNWKNWDPKIRDYPSAIHLVESFLKTELSLEMVRFWPGVSGFNPATISYTPGIWCEPVLMMHHISAGIGSDLYKFEKERVEDHKIDSTLRYADLWYRFMGPEDLNQTRHDWDNLSAESTNNRWNILFEKEGESDANRATRAEGSWEACKKSCDSNKYCLQWSYSSMAAPNWNENGFTKCHLSSSMRFGAHTEPEAVEVNGENKPRTWTSGWRKDHFKRWANQQRCKNQQH
ncbi:glycosyltransferase family 31 protein [Macroventuria anomochaeta]|uniref:Glycosyltransferase family 31 protein n=1 Tax=Macroventuria anomochaeta TaxID=301207 RepID=A0ACB6RZF3_9PLEO|nr:glycosyltransferase family 31 protein [Macroventuria anomochaeta]KAF2627154.1 glycosyltransferase family 31 protein [Macroventuria anomochaeta]